MPTPSDNHDLDLNYVEGEEWDYNDEMQTIEERLVVRDTEANLSNYTPHSAATFIATDTGAVYDGDGTNWNAATRSFKVVDTDELYNDGDILYFGGSGSGLVERLDPSTSSTPYQDVVDDIGSGGLIWAPPDTTVDEAGTLTGIESRIGLVCPGGFSTIRFTDTGSDGVEIGDSAVAYSGSYIDGINFDGDSAATRAGGSTDAWRFTGSERAFNVGRVYFRGWGDVIDFDGGAPGISRWGYLDFGFSTNDGANITSSGSIGAPPLTIDAIAAGSSNETATDAVLDFRSFQTPVHIGAINFGGNDGRAIYSAGAGALHIGRLNYEPGTDPNGGYAVTLDGESADTIQSIRQIGSSHTLDGVVRLGPNAGPANKDVGPIRLDGSVTLNESKVVVAAEPQTRSVQYHGPRDDVSFTTGSLPLTPIYCADGEAGFGEVEVGTTATTIARAEEAGVVFVTGVLQGSNDTFNEIVVWTRGGTAEVLGTSERNSPAGRTYNVDNVDLEVSMASDTYDVNVNQFYLDLY